MHPGITEIYHDQSGENRYYVMAKVKGVYTLLGWYPSYSRAEKAYKRAVKP